MKPLLFDTSIWVEHLRRDVLGALFPSVQRHFILGLDAIVAAELVAGCRSKRERRVVDALRGPFERAGRLLAPERADFIRAAAAISRLRTRGKNLSKPGSALLDGLIAAVAVREGALLITLNHDDFAMLKEEMPLRVAGFQDFAANLPSGP